MNLQPIIDIIQNNKSVSSTELEQAKELHKKFPFTSLFPMIILRGLKEKGDIHFESELRKLAIQIGDREVLERYLDGAEVLSKSLEQEGLIESELESESEEVLATQEEKVEESVVEDNAENVVEEKDVQKEQEQALRQAPSAAKGSPTARQEPQEFKDKLIEKADSDTPEEVKKSSSKSLELDPETKRIIAELQKKYGEDAQNEKENENEGENPSTTLRSLENENEVEISSAGQRELESVEKRELESESEEVSLKDGKSEDTTNGIEEKVESSEEVVSEKPKKEKKVSAEKSKKDKKRKKNKKKLKEKLDSQVKDSPFKFKEFKGEDEEYYHLEIDFSDLEPIHQEEEEDDFTDFDFANHPEIDDLVDGFIQNKDTKKEASKSSSKIDEPSKSAKKKESQKKSKTDSEKQDVDSSFTEPVKIKVSEKSEMTFLDWLKADKSASASAQQPIVQEREEEPTETSRIIDRFIDENPSISQVKKEFFSPTKNAKRSLEDEMEIVSETLAELHVFQENYSKAKKIYEKLILKFPEKKSLFAQKLEEIAFLRKKK